MKQYELEQALNEAEERAHDNLARYKFHNFGYWAAIWVHINRIGRFHRPNPFIDYVKLARRKGGDDVKQKSPVRGRHQGREKPQA